MALALAAEDLILRSSAANNAACSAHLSQIWALRPAINMPTSDLSRSQKEHLVPSFRSAIIGFWFFRESHQSYHSLSLLGLSSNNHGQNP